MIGLNQLGVINIKMSRIYIQGLDATEFLKDYTGKEITQRIYKWGEYVGILRPMNSWDEQWRVEIRKQFSSGNTDTNIRYVIEEYTLHPTSPPYEVDDCYDEHGTLYMINSNTSILVMPNMIICDGSYSELQTLLPRISPLISSLHIPRKDGQGSSLLQPPRLGLLPPMPQPERMSHVHSQHQSPRQSQVGTHRQQNYVRRDGPPRESHGQQEYATRPLLNHVSRRHVSGGYVPKMQDAGRNESNHRPQNRIHVGPKDHGQFRPRPQLTPLSASAAPRARGVPHFVEE
jgi:hypothetical protein